MMIETMKTRESPIAAPDDMADIYGELTIHAAGIFEGEDRHVWVCCKDNPISFATSLEAIAEAIKRAAGARNSHVFETPKIGTVAHQ